MKDVMRLALRGLTVPQIAHDLGLKTKAVDWIARRHGITLTKAPGGNPRAFGSRHSVTGAGVDSDFDDLPEDHQGE